MENLRKKAEIPCNFRLSWFMENINFTDSGGKDYKLTHKIKNSDDFKNYLLSLYNKANFTGISDDSLNIMAQVKTSSSYGKKILNSHVNLVKYNVIFSGWYDNTDAVPDSYADLLATKKYAVDNDRAHIYGGVAATNSNVTLYGKYFLPQAQIQVNKVDSNNATLSGAKFVVFDRDKLKTYINTNINYEAYGCEVENGEFKSSSANYTKLFTAVEAGVVKNKNKTSNTITFEDLHKATAPTHYSNGFEDATKEFANKSQALPAGYYVLWEKTAPDGYKKVNAQLFKIYLNNDGTLTVENTTANSGPIQVVDGVAKFTLVDKPLYAAIGINKVNPNKETLTGAKFVIFGREQLKTYINANINYEAYGCEVENGEFKSSSVNYTKLFTAVEAGQVTDKAGNKISLADVFANAAPKYFSGGSLVTPTTTAKLSDFTFSDRSQNLPAGTYVLWEETAPAGYKKVNAQLFRIDKTFVQDTTNKSWSVALTVQNTTANSGPIQVVNGVAVTAFTLVDKPLGVAIRIKKIDDTDAALAGAGFRVYNESTLDTFIASTDWTETDFSTAETTDEKALTYTKFFEAVEAGSVRTKVGNKRVVMDEIDAKDEAYNAQVPNASYTADDGSTAYTVRYDTNDEGLTQTPKLPYGNYVLWESKLPKEGLAKIDAFRFTVGAKITTRTVNDGNTEIEVVNGVAAKPFVFVDETITLGVRVIKKDAASGATVAKVGTEFELYVLDENGTYVLAFDNGRTFSTDANGIVMIEDIPFGTYALKELNATSGFYNPDATNPNNDSFRAVFTLSGASDFTRYYKLKDGTYTTDTTLNSDLYVHKSASAVAAVDFVDFQEVVFNNTETKGELTIEKVAERLTGYTKENGFQYTYRPLDGAVFEIVAETDILSPDGQTTWYKAGDVVATAVTGNSDTVSCADCGETFTSGVSVIEGRPNYVSIEQGMATSGKVKITLPLGKYTVREVHTIIGYDLADEQSVELTYSSQDDEAVSVSVVVHNDYVRRKKLLTKTDSESKAFMPGVQFGVYNADPLYNTVNQTMIYSANSLLAVVTTDENGVADSGYLPIADGKNTGRYYFKEMQKVPGYLENTTQYEFTLTEDHLLHTQVDDTNVEVENIPDPKIHIEKEQSVNGGARTKEELQVVPGDVITYYVTISADEENATPAKDIVITDEIPELLFIKSGTLSDGGTVKNRVITWTWDKLDPHESKTFTFECIIPTVSGETYFRNSATAIFKEEDILSNEVVSVERVGNILVKKYQPNGKTPLMGVSFEIKNAATNEVVSELTTDAKGEVKFENLPPATYILTETNTVNGYQLLSESITIELPYVVNEEDAASAHIDTSKGQWDEGSRTWRFFDLTYTVVNDIQMSIPMTGGAGVRVVACAAALALTAGGYFLLRMKRKDGQN